MNFYLYIVQYLVIFGFPQNVVIPKGPLWDCYLRGSHEDLTTLICGIDVIYVLWFC